MIFWNKKGDERFMSLYWMLIFVIITVVVVSGTVLFFVKPIDIREVEGRILIDRLVECFVENGEIKKDLFLKTEGKDLEQTCKLNFDDSNYDDGQYFVKVSGVGREIEFGADTEPFCGQEDRKKRIPFCVRKKIAVLDGNSLVQVEFTAVIGKVRQNAV